MRTNVRNAIIIAVVIIVIVIVAAVALTSDTNSNSNSTVNATSDVEVNNTTLVYTGYGTYNITADITPLKDFSYLEIQLEFYDSSDNLLDKDTLVWNINNPTKDQMIKATGSAYLQSSTDPAYAKMYIVETGFGDSSDSIYNETVNITRNK